MASSEENTNKCLKYIEDSFKLLERAKEAAINNNSTQKSEDDASSTSSSDNIVSWRENAIKDFQESFPGSMTLFA